MSDPADDAAMTEAARLTARAAALFILGQMRLVEERVTDRRAWWGTLRTALERFIAGGGEAA